MALGLSSDLKLRQSWMKSRKYWSAPTNRFARLVFLGKTKCIEFVYLSCSKRTCFLVKYWCTNWPFSIWSLRRWVGRIKKNNYQYTKITIIIIIIIIISLNGAGVLSSSFFFFKFSLGKHSNDPDDSRKHCLNRFVMKQFFPCV